MSYTTNVVAPPALRLRRLAAADDPATAHVIRQIPTECGLTADKGYTVADPSLDELYQVYSQPGHTYWAVKYEDEMVDGGRIAPLTRSESDVRELQKMYFLPTIRDRGLTKRLTLMAME